MLKLYQGRLGRRRWGGRIQLTELGRRLQFDMNLQQKAMKRIKMDGGEAEALLDEMFAEIEWSCTRKFLISNSMVLRKRGCDVFHLRCFGKLIVANNMRSLNISIGKCGSLSSNKV